MSEYGPESYVCQLYLKYDLYRLQNLAEFGFRLQNFVGYSDLFALLMKKRIFNMKSYKILDSLLLKYELKTIGA